MAAWPASRVCPSARKGSWSAAVLGPPSPPPRGDWLKGSAPEGAPWPPPGPMAVQRRLHVILDEEWWHLQFAKRDLAAWPTTP